MSGRAIIFDLDGTIADVRHRLSYVRGAPPNWPAFFDACVDDVPHAYVVELMHLFDHASMHITAELDHELTLIICSGRPDSHRAQTETWLSQYGIPYDVLLMRDAGDHRPDTVVKKEMLDNIRGQGYEVLFAVDDRPSVVAMWRANDVPCFVVDDSAWHDPGPVEHAGKTLLTLMVGPSGAGKTTWLYTGGVWRDDAMHFGTIRPPALVMPEIKNNYQILASDQFREEICGDWRDQSKNAHVFDALHDIARTRLRHGLPTIIDATHIRRKDRLASAALAPTGTIVRYVVMDRPLGDKLLNPRTPEDVIRRHDHTFRSQLHDILAGDGLPNVKVVDLRPDAYKQDGHAP